jgi:hypothetical protein
MRSLRECAALAARFDDKPSLSKSRLRLPPSRGLKATVMIFARSNNYFKVNQRAAIGSSFAIAGL